MARASRLAASGVSIKTGMRSIYRSTAQSSFSRSSVFQYAMSERVRKGSHCS